ncbi:MAG: hypothetical protein A2020_07135 [Lentisphaerae bacterium GWF2_45_14]|nr:MAG: hypothetical protein A2020_07135 [Lentisphaerae bacterium GWF2_45_14]
MLNPVLRIVPSLILLLLSNACLNQQQSCTQKNPLILEDDSMKIIFCDSSKGFSCDGIVNKAADNHKFVKAPEKNPALWRIEFRSLPNSGDKKNNCFITSLSDSEKSFTREDNSITMSWKNLSLPGEKNIIDVTVVITLSNDSGSRWEIKVDNKSKKYGAWIVEYPILSNTSTPGTADVVFPGGKLGGFLKKNNVEAGYFTYPSIHCPVQFISLSIANSGLYFAAHDGESKSKAFQISVDQSIAMKIQPENMGMPGTGYNSTFPVVVKPFKGNWWHAAKIYRAWALKQKWAQKEKLIDRKDIPVSFKECGAWLLLWQGSSAIKEFTLLAQKTLNAPVGAHWYEWTTRRSDKEYPYYFPVRSSNMKEVAEELVNSGNTVMPYINGRIWDQSNTDFYEPEVQSCLALKPDLKSPYTESYASKQIFSAMCPTQEFWQKKVINVAKELALNYGINAIYIDQTGAASPANCFNKSHNHPLGGGSYWVDGYRDMLTKIHASFSGKHVALTTEGAAEPYMDNIDGFLGFEKYSHESIPLCQAVYSGYNIYFIHPMPDNGNFNFFVMMQGRLFLWGIQNTWLSHKEMEGEGFLKKYEKQTEFLKKLIAVKLEAKKYMIYGELLGELSPLNDIPQINATWEPTSKTPVSFSQSAVMGSIWKAGDGSRGVALLNFSGAPQVFEYDIKNRKRSVYLQPYEAKFSVIDAD